MAKQDSANLDNPYFSGGGHTMLCTWKSVPQDENVRVGRNDLEMVIIDSTGQARFCKTFVFIVNDDDNVTTSVTHECVSKLDKYLSVTRYQAEETNILIQFKTKHTWFANYANLINRVDGMIVGEWKVKIEIKLVK
jgi:hypothetical protein